LLTAQELLDLSDPIPTDLPAEVWRPTAEDIRTQLYSIIFDNQQNFIKRPKSRLYLYFSGHGFTSDLQPSSSAALFTAEAAGNNPANLGGTLCAEALAKVAIFGQIVLIMDCCRDAFGTKPYGQIVVTDAEAPSAQCVPVMQIYAGPKGAKAQEGELQPGGPTVGYLTHAVLKALREVPPNVLGQVSARRLDDYISMKWPKLCPLGTSPPKPRIASPSADQAPIYFTCNRDDLVDQQFSVPSVRSGDFKVYLRSSMPNGDLPQNDATFTDKVVSWIGSDPRLDVPLSEPDEAGRQTFTLRLLTIPHDILSPGIGGVPLVFNPGGDRVDL
jgi:hypothetical protein